jgi:hypothetical protein
MGAIRNIASAVELYQGLNKTVIGSIQAVLSKEPLHYYWTVRSFND